MKKSKKIALIIGITLLFFIIAPFIALRISAVQRLIAHKTTEFVSEWLHADFHVDKISLNHITRIDIDSAYLADQQDQKMLAFSKMKIHFRLIPLFRGEVSIKRIEVDNLYANAYYRPDSVANFQFFVDAVTPKKKRDLPGLDFPNIILNNAEIYYADWRNNIDVDLNDVNANVKFSMSDDRCIDLAVKDFSIKHEDKPIINDLQFKLRKDGSYLSVNDFFADLPNSHIQVDRADMEIVKKDSATIDWINSSFIVDIAPSKLSLKDLAFIKPSFKNVKHPVLMEIHAEGKSNRFEANKIYLNYNNELVVDANLNAKDIMHLDQAHAQCNIQDIRLSAQSVKDIVSAITEKDINLPKVVNQLGVCKFNGFIDGTIENVKLIGNLSTSIGNVNTNVSLLSPDTFHTASITGKISTTDINLRKIIPDPKLGLGSTKLDLVADAKINKNHDFIVNLNGKIHKATIKDYTYNNISVNGELTPSKFEGNLKLNDANGKLDFNGKLNMNSSLKDFVFTADIDNLNPNKLNLIKSNPDMTLSMRVNSDVNGRDASSLNGFVNIDSIVVNNTNHPYCVNRLHLTTVNNNDTNFININSDLMEGNIYGKYQLPDIYGHIINTLSNDMPILKKMHVSKPSRECDITMSVDVFSLENLMKAAGIKWYTTDVSTIHMSYKSASDRLSAYINIPSVTNGSLRLDSTILNVGNFRGTSILLQTATDIKMGHMNAEISIHGQNDTITSNIIWDNNNSTNFFGGELLAKTKLNVENERITSNTVFYPTEFLLKDDIWQTSYCTLSTRENNIGINNFGLTSSGNQSITINGNISKDPLSKLIVDITNLNLDNISNLLPEQTPISFGGTVSANGQLVNILSDVPQINAHARSEAFSFNDVPLGNLDASCTFDMTQNCLNFRGLAFENQDTTAYLKGNIYTKADSIDIKGLADGFDLSILNFYLEDFLGAVSGYGFGDVHIYGKKKHIAIDVDALAYDASIGVNALGTTYHFTDSIHVDRSVIDFDTIQIFDETGHSGYLSGKINHNFLRNYNLDLFIHSDSMIVMNTTKDNNPSFFGNVYALGDVWITGTEKNVNITGIAETVNHSKITIPIDNYTAKENSFITFQSNILGPIQVEQQPKSSSNILMNLMIDVSPETEGCILTNSKTGDMLRMNATGNLKLTYNLKESDMKLFGNLQVIQGSYLFTLQEIIRKEFKFEEGGTLTWNGDPINADLDVTGYYQLNADVSELLDQSQLLNVTRTTLPVQCVLNLTGPLTQPNVQFDINVPDNNEEELNRAIHNTINTSEMLNRQVIGLLLMGKFFKPENEANNTFLSQNELYTMVSSTLSAQLNNWASQMFDNWGFGVNFRRSGEGTTANNEYEFNFQYAPTSRILINGNVGYRDNSTTTNKFIGDFDVEYKLIQSGRLRIKAYTHTNDYREFRKGLTTQGLGIVWTESFNSGKELRQTWKTNAEKNKQARQKKQEARKQKREAKKAERLQQKASKE